MFGVVSRDSESILREGIVPIGKGGEHILNLSRPHKAVRRCVEEVCKDVYQTGGYTRTYCVTAGSCLGGIYTLPAPLIGSQCILLEDVTRTQERHVLSGSQ